MPISVGSPFASLTASFEATDGALSASGVSFSVGCKRLLDQISLRIEPGKIFAVVGPNGAGKTTLLRLLSGEQTAHAGRIHLNDQPIGNLTSVERAQRIAVLPQQSSLNASLTVMEVVLLGRAPHQRQSTAETNLQIVHATLAATNTIHLADRLYPSLSGGEKSRVQVARVLAQIWEPPRHGTSRFLLLDEPTAALDPAHQRRLLDCARHCAQRGIGVFTILHDLNLTARYADQVLLLAEGRTIAQGTPEAVFQPPLLSEIFGMDLTIIPHPTDGCLLVV